ncbi:MAG: GTP-sensing pleiotropic transcriptional regulator CodY [Anaerovoracaceae bacterium]
MQREKLLEKIRKLSWVLQESAKGVFTYDEIATIMSEVMLSNVYIVDASGTIVGCYYNVEKDSIAEIDPKTGFNVLPLGYNVELLKLHESSENLKGEEAFKLFNKHKETKEKWHTIIPLRGGGARIGTLILTRYSPKFTEADIVFGEASATIIALDMERKIAAEQEKEDQEIEAVKQALFSLSYSETDAVKRVFAALDSEEGILVASKIADNSGITRSVIVNAIRKLESAGVIESRSLGMKGTHIKVLNSKLYLLLEEKKAK